MGHAQRMPRLPDREPYRSSVLRRVRVLLRPCAGADPEGDGVVWKTRDVEGALDRRRVWIAGGGSCATVRALRGEAMRAFWYVPVLDEIPYQPQSRYMKRFAICLLLALGSSAVSTMYAQECDGECGPPAVRMPEPSAIPELAVAMAGLGVYAVRRMKQNKKA